LPAVTARFRWQPFHHESFARATERHTLFGNSRSNWTFHPPQTSLAQTPKLFGLAGRACFRATARSLVGIPWSQNRTRRHGRSQSAGVEALANTRPPGTTRPEGSRADLVCSIEQAISWCAVPPPGLTDSRTGTSGASDVVAVEITDVCFCATASIHFLFSRSGGDQHCTTD